MAGRNVLAALALFVLILLMIRWGSPGSMEPGSRPSLSQAAAPPDTPEATFPSRADDSQDPNPKAEPATAKPETVAPVDIRGQVVAKETYRRISGATVRLWEADPLIDPETYCRETATQLGDFYFPRVSPGRYWIECEAKGFVHHFARQIDIESGIGVHTIELVRNPREEETERTDRAALRVQSRDDVNIHGIYLKHPATGTSTMRNMASPEGRSTFTQGSILPGHYRIVVMGRSGAAAYDLHLRAGEVTEITFPPPNAKMLRIEVRDSRTQQPIPEASVIVLVDLHGRGQSRALGHVVETDARGACEIGPMGEPRLDLDLRAPGYAPTTVERIGSLAGRGPQVHFLEPEGQLRVVLTQPDGHPVADARVELTSPRKQHLEGRTDEHGICTFGGLGRRTYLLHLERGGVPHRPPPFGGLPGQVIEKRIEWPGEVTLWGIVQRNGAPLNRTWIEFEGTGSSTKTSPHGEFKRRFLAGRGHRVVARWEGGGGNAGIVDPAAGPLVRLSFQTHRVLIRTSGTPLPAGTRVRWKELDQTLPVEAEAVLDDRGRAELEVTAGRYEVTTLADDLVLRRRVEITGPCDVELRCPGTFELPLPVPEMPQLVRLVDPNGALTFLDVRPDPPRVLWPVGVSGRGVLERAGQCPAFFRVSSTGEITAIESVVPGRLEAWARDEHGAFEVNFRVTPLEEALGPEAYWATRKFGLWVPDALFAPGRYRVHSVTPGIEGSAEATVRSGQTTRVDF